MLFILVLLNNENIIYQEDLVDDVKGKWNIFPTDAFSKQALESQWDRVRVICRQPFRMDKQFGLSFMRIGSPPGDTIASSPDWVSGKAASSTSGQPSDEENDEDGVKRLKKASGLMGCLR